MPMGERSRARSQAKVFRQTGQSVVLLISANENLPIVTNTPFSLVANQSPAPASDDIPVTIYARVSYKNFEDDKFDEGGRVINQKATIEGSVKDMPSMVKCYAVQLQDGSRLRVNSRRWSDGRQTFLLDVASYAVVGE